MCKIFCLEILVKFFLSGGNEGESCVLTGCFCVYNSCCSDGIYKFYLLVTFASYTVVADVEVADVEMADVEEADVVMVDVEMVEGVVFLLQLALDRTVGCSMLLCFCGMDTEDLLSSLMLAVKTDFILDLYSFF